ncbi:hypothetical protein DH2020_008548 [Rehmannia glutinosa]|uniref:Uncharacterized protein n=1 Tax=Rehmannia glutinosa TaxID=99300 RepID=A0ABR0X770_REHGL
MSGGGRRKRSLRRSLCVAVKAVFFKSSLLKKSDSKQDLDRLSSNLSSKSKRFVKSMRKNFSYKSCWEPEPEEIFRTSSNSSSLFSSNSSRHTATSSILSSSSSSSSLSASSGPEPIKRSVSVDFRQMNPNMNRQKSIKRDCARKCFLSNPTFEMLIFLVSLVALVFWGKAFAIVTCTSTWLLLAPRRRGHRLRRVGSNVNDVVDSVEYKKRVIMEGLLERNRSRVFQL